MNVIAKNRWRPSAVIGALLVTIALALVACGGSSTPSGDAAATPTQTPTTMPDPAETPTPADTPDPFVGYWKQSNAWAGDTKATLQVEPPVNGMYAAALSAPLGDDFQISMDLTVQQTSDGVYAATGNNVGKIIFRLLSPTLIEFKDPVGNGNSKMRLRKQ